MLRTPLRPYQEAARDRALIRLRTYGGFALFLEQRTGKTLIALSIVDAVLEEIPNLIIVCPKTAIPVWRAAIAKEATPNWVDNIEILNYEKLVNNRQDWYSWGRAHNGKFIMICDEMHFIKRRGTSRSRCVRHLSTFARYRLGLTGTPIGNGLQDAWSQMNFVNPQALGPWDDIYEGKGKAKRFVAPGFASTYLVFGGYYKHNVVSYRNEEQFQKIFHENSYRVTLREVRPKPLLLRYSKAFVTLSSRTKDIYEEIQRELVTTVNERVIKAKNVLSCLIKCQQITGGYAASEDGNVAVGTEKIEKLHEVVRSLRSRSKFVVIARFIWEIERIAAVLKSAGYKTQIVRGGIPYDGKFSCDAIVMQIQSGVAVDMSKADSIIFYSIDYSYLNYEQARFRILSYEKPVAHYYFLLARDTVDEQIYEAVTSKKNVADYVCDYYRTKGHRDEQKNSGRRYRAGKEGPRRVGTRLPRRIRPEGGQKSGKEG